MMRMMGMTAHCWVRFVLLHGIGRLERMPVAVYDPYASMACYAVEWVQHTSTGNVCACTSRLFT